MTPEQLAHGYLPVSRKMFDGDDPIWEAKEPFDRRSAWVDLCQLAAFSPRRRLIGSDVVLLERGQLLASERYLAERWHWTRSKVTRFFDVLKKLERIVVNPDHPANHLGAIVTLLNYESYNPTPTKERTTNQTNGEPGASQVRAKEEEGKEFKEGKEEDQVVVRALRSTDGTDRELLVNQIIRAANAGMQDNAAIDQHALRPIPIGHGTSRQAALDWLNDGIPWETIVEAVYFAAAEYKPNDRHRQILSLSYCDNPVRDRHEEQAARALPRPARAGAPSAPHPDAEVNRVRSETPGAFRAHSDADRERARLADTKPVRLSKLLEEMAAQGLRVPRGLAAGGAR